MTIYTAIRPLTGIEFQRMVEEGLFDEDARIELLDGRIHEMAPVGIPHTTIVKRLILHFTDLFHRQYLIQVQDPIALTHDSHPQPDVALLRWRDDVYADHLPTPSEIVLLVEASDTSLDVDLNVKVPRYAAAGIPETWVIDVNRAILHQFHTPTPEKYLYQKSFQRGDSMTTTLGVTIQIDAILVT